MFSHWSAALVAKTKAAALIATSLAAGGVGGAIALSHVAPSGTTQILRSADSSAAPTSTDPETTDSQGSGSSTGTGDPETTDSQSSGSGPVSPGSTGGYTLPPCPADVKNHGQYVSSVARSAPKGKHGEHGKWVSQAARSDCGKHHANSGSTDPESGAAQSGDTGSSGQAKNKTPGHAGKHHGSSAAGSSGHSGRQGHGGRHSQP
jgi:hypothetical protein